MKQPTTPKTPAITVTQDLALTTTTTEARIDSRLLAQGFGNRHKAAMTLIDRYEDRFKAHGQLTFKKTVGKRKQGGGNAERYALLNEDQAYLLLSLSRNTDTVVTLKSRLVQAFGNARRAAAMRKTEYLPEYHHLHDALHVLANGSPNERHVHINVNRLLNKFAGIEAGHRASAAMPQQALLIVGHLVASKTVQGATDNRDAYQGIKATLHALEGALALEGGAHG
ncbi:Rha family transcriptional regulator [Rhodoferax sp.]|uniref:Rha family transcriptional regulator n=1 Tax=Rhodoferax sp. TaxID=50421 RepID=UPI00262B54BC|nr:Rha family transcriptional regulator [Rhodoferax sp.]MDD2809279.1 Rha family transcriptional regulator [Rhodoferax sp.]